MTQPSSAPRPAAAAFENAPMPLPEDLERAHDALGQCALVLERIDTPPMDLTEAARTLELTFERLFASYRRVEDPARCLPEAREALAAFQAELARDAGHPMLGMVRDLASNVDRHLTDAETRLRAAPWAPPAAPAEQRASLRQLRLHEITRPNLVARVRVAPALPPEVQTPAIAAPTPATFEELDAAVARLRDQAAERARPKLAAPADAPPAPDASPSAEPDASAFVAKPGTAWSRRRFVEERATGAFEEVLLSWIQRLPIGGERWQSAVFIEQRMLAGVDAIVALGPDALQHLETITLGNPTRTPAHLAALTVALGCVEGRDTLALAERLLYEQESIGPEWAESFAAALALVPHPDASRLAWRFAHSPHANHRALGMRVLVRRGVFDRELFWKAAHDEPDVAAEALPTLANSLRGDEARPVLDQALARSEEHPAMRVAALRALSWSYYPPGGVLLLEEFQKKDSAEAAILLAQGSSRVGANQLLEWVRPRPTAAGAQALGWTGLLDAIPVLIAALGSPDELLQAASAEALDRITGAGLREEVEIPPEAVLDPDVPDPVPDDGPSLAQKVRSPRDQPEAGSPDRVERITRDPQRWRAWWVKNGPQWDPNLRFRRGYPWTPHIVWRELSQTFSTPADRRWLKHELVLRTSSQLHCDPADLVAHQELTLAAAEHTATAASRAAPGSWSEAQRR